MLPLPAPLGGGSRLSARRWAVPVEPSAKPADHFALSVLLDFDPRRHEFAIPVQRTSQPFLGKSNRLDLLATHEAAHQAPPIWYLDAKSRDT